MTIRGYAALRVNAALDKVRAGRVRYRMALNAWSFRAHAETGCGLSQFR